jgi:hypothetical protein
MRIRDISDKNQRVIGILAAFALVSTPSAALANARAETGVTATRAPQAIPEQSAAMKPIPLPMVHAPKASVTALPRASTSSPYAMDMAGKGLLWLLLLVLGGGAAAAAGGGGGRSDSPGG